MSTIVNELFVLIVKVDCFDTVPTGPVRVYELYRVFRCSALCSL